MLGQAGRWATYARVEADGTAVNTDAGELQHLGKLDGQRRHFDLRLCAVVRDAVGSAGSSRCSGFDESMLDAGLARS